MNDRNRIWVIGILTAIALCWVILESKQREAQQIPAHAREPGAEKAKPAPATRPESSRPPIQTPPSPEFSEPAEPGGVESQLSPVTPVPRTVSMASIDHTPAFDRSARGASDAADLPPVTALENLRSAFHQYAARCGGNPVGDNAEITAALLGQNPRQQVFVSPEDGLRTDSQGRMMDPWGTPYFFHQLSRTETEIRSAGPDRRMWTSDDLVMK